MVAALRSTVARAAGLAAAALTAGAVLASGAACTNPDDGRLDVVTGVYPFQFLAEEIGGDRIDVVNLSPPGGEPHDLELSPHQLATIADAELVIYLAGFQPVVDEAVAQNATDAAFDIGTVVTLLPAPAHVHDDAESSDHAGAESADTDPHVWLDPTRFAAIAGAVGERLAVLDPAGAEGYRDRARLLSDRLLVLDTEYVSGLDTCDRREIVTSHTAFGYLAQRYDLDQIGITGLSPETEPTPARLAEVTEEARRHGATTIFFETLVSPKVAEAIATEVGATTAVLDPLEGLTPGSADDYFTVMRRNLSVLQNALGCP